MFLEAIFIFLAGFAGVFIVRVIIKLTGVLIIKFIANTYHSLNKMLNKRKKQQGQK